MFGGDTDGGTIQYLFLIADAQETTTAECHTAEMEEAKEHWRDAGLPLLRVTRTTPEFTWMIERLALKA